MRRIGRRFVSFVVTAVVLMVIVNHVLRYHIHPTADIARAAATHPVVNIVQPQTVAHKGPAAVHDTANADDSSDMSDDSDKSDSSDASDDSDSASGKTSASANTRSGQSRTVTIGRQFRAARDSASPVKVDVSYGVGTMNVHPADAPWLYDVRMAYDPAIMTPSVAFDTAARSLTVHSKSVTVEPSHHNDGGELQLSLARHVPLDVQVEFGAGENTMQFGGLSVRTLSVSTGASETTVGFDTPNGTDLDHLTLEIGAAGFKATGLGNARVHDMTVEAGAGDVELDFGGHWTGDVTLEVKAALGAVHIHIPYGVVVDHISTKTFIGAFEDNTGGLAGAGAAQTPGGPIYHLRFRGTTALGSVELDHHTGT